MMMVVRERERGIISWGTQTNKHRSRDCVGFIHKPQRNKLIHGYGLNKTVESLRMNVDKHQTINLNICRFLSYHGIIS